MSKFLYPLKQQSTIVNKLTFEQLPQAIALLLEKVSFIESILTGEKVGDYLSKEMLTSNEAAAFMGISISQRYKLTHRQELPTYKPGGKKIYLKRGDLVDWLSKNRVSSKEEVERAAINWVIKIL